MRRWIARVIVGGVTSAAVLILILIIALLAAPPWHNKYSQRVQEWLGQTTGVQLHYLDDYTGTVRFWDDQGRLRQEFHLVDGYRDGTWTEFDESGDVTLHCTYRQGELWDGVGYLIDMKAWMGEYKQGKPWNGCLLEPSPSTGRLEWQCFVDGKVMSQEEYKRRFDIHPDADLIGLHSIEP